MTSKTVIQTFMANNEKGITRAESMNSEWNVESLLGDVAVTCLTLEPLNRNRIYAGTRSQGILKSDDRGITWQTIGMNHHVIKSIAVSSADPDAIYVGTKPPAIFISRDGGQSWIEQESFRKLRQWFWFTPAEAGDPYVMGLAVSPTNPDLVIAGVEFGGMFRSRDGGQTWEGHLKSTSRDCHQLSFHHTDGTRVYQAGGGWPAAVSADCGVTWSQRHRGMGWSLYGMAVAADPGDSSIWYVSAAPHAIFPHLHKMPRGHFDGEANAFIFRKRDSEKWERLGGGLPQPLNHMANALVTDPDSPGHLYAGLSNGDVWHTSDYGDHWQKKPFNLKCIRYSLVIV